MLWIVEVEMVDSSLMKKGPRDQLLDRIFQTLTCWTRRLPLFWTRSFRIPSSRRRSVSRSRNPKRRAGSYEEERSPSWSTTIFEYLTLMIPYWIMLICSLLLFMTILWRNSTPDGMKFSRDKRLPLDTWNQSGLQENVFRNEFSTFDSSRDYSRRIQSDGFYMPVELPQNYMVGQQRQQISELQFDKFPNQQSFLVWKIPLEPQIITCFVFFIGCYVVNQRSGDGRFKRWKKVLAISQWKGFSKLRDAAREDRLCSEQDHSASRTSFYEEDRSPSWSTTTFKWLALMIQY